MEPDAERSSSRFDLAKSLDHETILSERASQAFRGEAEGDAELNILLFGQADRMLKRPIVAYPLVPAHPIYHTPALVWPVPELPYSFQQGVLTQFAQPLSM
jgi:hypothetical protein